MDIALSPRMAAFLGDALVAEIGAVDETFGTRR